MNRLDGTVLLQTRVLPQMWNICQLPFQSTHRLPNSAELSAFLSFLSIISISSGFKFDPTVPSRDLYPFLKCAEEFELAEITGLQVGEDSDLIEDSRIAFCLANTEVNYALNNRVFSKGPKPFDKKITDGFVNALSAISKADTETDRTGIALESYQSGQTGGKLLLGIAAQHEHRIAGKVILAFEQNEHGAVLSTLIDLFRTNLLASWAGREGTSIVTDQQAIDRLHAHQANLWAEMEREIRRQSNAPIQNYMNETCDFPMFGALILLLAPPESRPLDLVKRAFSFRNEFEVDKLAKEFWNLPWQEPTDKHKEIVRTATADLLERVRSRGGPKREELGHWLMQAPAAVIPAIGPPLGAVANIFAGGDFAPAIAAVVTSSAWSLTYCLSKVPKHDRPAAALSNALQRYNEIAHLFQDQVQKIWSHRT